MKSSIFFLLWLIAISSGATTVDVSLQDACLQTITTDGLIELPPYPVPPIEPCKIYMWHVTVDAYNINITISNLDLDTRYGDYLIFSPGSTLVKDEASIVVTGTITTPKMFRLVNHGEMIVLYVTQRRKAPRKANNFQISYVGYGDLTTEAPTTEPPTTLPTAPSNVEGNIDVYVSGMKPADFYINEVLNFKASVAEMANIYCPSANIPLLENATSKNVLMHEITQCDITWPNWETCTKINMAVSVYVPASNSYQMTREHLQQMWDTFASNNLPTGVQPYQRPDAEGTFLLWLYIALGVAVLFTVVMLIVWRLDLFNRNGRKFSELIDPTRSHSEVSIKSWISESYQEMPPIFADLPQEDTYVEPPIHDVTEDINTYKTPPPTAPPADTMPSEYEAAFVFGKKLVGFDNPAFDSIREESQQQDDFSSSDEEAVSNQSKQKHKYGAPQQVRFEDDGNESVF